MVLAATCPHYLALRPYLRTFGGVVGLVAVWAGLVQLLAASWHMLPCLVAPKAKPRLRNKTMNTADAIASFEHVSVQERIVGDVRWLHFEPVVPTGPGSHRRRL